MNIPCAPPPGRPTAHTHPETLTSPRSAGNSPRWVGPGTSSELRAPFSAGCQADQSRAGQARLAKPVPRWSDGRFKPCDLLPKPEFQAAETSARGKNKGKL